MKKHKPVLLKESIGLLNFRRGDIFIDATLGNGGHSREILKKLRKGTLIAIDVDQNAIAGCQKELEKLAEENSNKIYFANDNFANLDKVLNKLKVKEVDAILADLGWRADQVENEKYGLSFRKNSLLDMRLGGISTSLSAKDIVNNYQEKELADIFRKYGEERYAGKAARAISIARKTKEIKTTRELAEIIEKSIGGYYKKFKIHPATRIFQALRIEINREIENLKEFMPKALKCLKRGGRLAIISFHSLEDREVKKFFQANARGCICPKGAPICFCGKKPEIKKITKKPVVSGREELEENFRSRSAKLRVAEKV